MTDKPAPPADVHAAAAQGDGSILVGHLPNQGNCPAIPYWAASDGKSPDWVHAGAAAAALKVRADKAEPAYDGLTTLYTIAGQTKPAYEFLYPANGVWNALNELAVDDPSQFTLPWTNYDDVYTRFQDVVEAFAASLTSMQVATASFWPLMANFGVPFNLIGPAKIDQERCAALAAEFGDAWAADEMDALQAAGLLYEIDMSIMALEKETVSHPTTKSTEVRFTPGTLTVLRQDPQSKQLTPVLIRVSPKGGAAKTFGSTDKGNAWLYALQAAKTSIAVYGIWLGHVYHWHIVSAALQMTMYQALPRDHRLWSMFAPLSQAPTDFDFVLLTLIDFDFVLLKVAWDTIAPPTPVSGAASLLSLLVQFSEDREFFDDDPLSELEQRGLSREDFTVHDDWDAYPVAGYLLKIWRLTHEYVSEVVNVLYPTDGDVKNDPGLKAWMDASRDPSQGNISGLPAVDTQADLIAVLTSFLYRLTAHGASSLSPSVNPALALVANFPPCLQSDHIPEPGSEMTTQQLLDLLPHTGTQGGMTTFYFTFAYTPPDRSLIPSGGINLDAYYPPEYQACNDALFRFRQGVRDFVVTYTLGLDHALREWWGLKSGGPADPNDLYQQWPPGIEI
jgi:hypothetical protein